MAIAIYLGWDRTAWTRAAAWWLKAFPDNPLPTANLKGLEALQRLYDEAHDPPPDTAQTWVEYALRSARTEYIA